MSVAEASGMAMARAAASVMGSIRETMDLKSPAQLVPGEYVRLAGEWVRFVGLDPDGGLRVYRVDSACSWTYPPTDGETFVWHEGAF